MHNNVYKIFLFLFPYLFILLPCLLLNQNSLISGNAEFQWVLNQKQL